MARPKKDQNAAAVADYQEPKDTRTPYQILLDLLNEAESTAGEIVKSQIAAGGPIIKEAKVYV